MRASQFWGYTEVTNNKPQKHLHAAGETKRADLACTKDTAHSHMLIQGHAACTVRRVHQHLFQHERIREQGWPSLAMAPWNNHAHKSAHVLVCTCLLCDRGRLKQLRGKISSMQSKGPSPRSQK
jgi:hypothetical protein